LRLEYSCAQKLGSNHRRRETPGTMATATKSKKRKPAPVDEDVELEELDEDVEDESPKKKRRSGGEEVEFGVADLAAHLKKLTGKEYSTRDLRTLIRKMAREDKARVKRE